MPKKSQNAWGGTTGQAAGRLLIALIFFASAFGKFSSFDKHTGGPQMPYLSAKLDGAKAHIQALTGFHVPIEKAMYPQILLFSATVEFLGALLFASDIRFGAYILISFLIPTTLIMHNFWDFQDNPAVMQGEMAHFMKNVSIVGALVYFLATSSGTRHKNRYDSMMDEIANEKKRY